jgi:deoxyribodipyrimidine photo-lyase
VWFRRDLRTRDHPALAEALATGAPVVPVYVLDEAAEGPFGLGAASRWWLRQSLAALDASLGERGGRLVLARGEASGQLGRLAAETGARAVYWNRCYEPASRGAERCVRSALEALGVEPRGFSASLLFEPEGISNKQGGPFQVFTPFWRHCLERLDDTRPVERRPLPERIPVPAVASARLEDLGLSSGAAWESGLKRVWTPGEEAARKGLKHFLTTGLADYATARDLPYVEGGSRLSAHLHFGEITPAQVLAALRRRSSESGVFPDGKGAQVFLAQLGWREFAHHLLWHFPETPLKPLRSRFEPFPWARDPGGTKFRAWQRGETGYPIVDAGMRELWATGWMHNRVRMIVASFLVKHLRLPWTEGARWFWDTLVDADLANNTLGWQWSAGCGADAAPYFRIFNPVLQGEKFDPEGLYVRRWLPELSGLPKRTLHRPWETGGVAGYPAPLVEHSTARAEALAAFKGLAR